MSRFLTAQTSGFKNGTYVAVFSLGEYGIRIGAMWTPSLMSSLLVGLMAGSSSSLGAVFRFISVLQIESLEDFYPFIFY